MKDLAKSMYFQTHRSQPAFVIHMFVIFVHELGLCHCTYVAQVENN